MVRANVYPLFIMNLKIAFKYKKKAFFHERFFSFYNLLKTRYQPS